MSLALSENAAMPSSRSTGYASKKENAGYRPRILSPRAVCCGCDVAYEISDQIGHLAFVRHPTLERRGLVCLEEFITGLSVAREVLTATSQRYRDCRARCR
jgi:hypothetical protein